MARSVGGLTFQIFSICLFGAMKKGFKCHSNHFVKRGFTEGKQLDQGDGRL